MVNKGDGVGRWKCISILVMLVLASFLPYANIFKNDFAYDDIGRIVKNNYIKDWSKLPDIITHSSRPLRDITFMIDHSLWGLNVVGWHITNVLLHAITTFLVFYLAKLLLTRTSSSGVPLKAESSAFWIACGAALLFATHPVHTEAVTGISNRQESMMTIFLIAAMLTWQRRSKTWLWYPLSLGFIALALSSKQLAFIAPLLLILQDLWYKKGVQGKYFLRYLPFLPVGLYLIWFINRLQDQQTFGNISNLQRLYIMSWALLKSLGILLWPSSLSTHIFVPIRSHIDGLVLCCWGLLVLGVIFIWRSFRHRHLLGFLTAAYLVSWIPCSNLLPYTWVIAERYLYFLSVFFCLAVSWLLFHIIERFSHSLSTRQRSTVLALFFAVISVAYSVTALDRNRDWRNELTLMTATTRTNPRAYQPHFRLGNLLAEKGRLEEALSHYQSAFRIMPFSANAGNNLGYTYMRMGKYEKAKSVYQQVLAKHQKHHATIYNMACLASLQGKPAEALQWLQSLSELAPIKKFPIQDDPDLEAFRASKYYEMLMQPSPK